MLTKIIATNTFHNFFLFGDKSFKTCNRVKWQNIISVNMPFLVKHDQANSYFSIQIFEMRKTSPPFIAEVIVVRIGQLDDG